MSAIAVFRRVSQQPVSGSVETATTPMAMARTGIPVEHRGPVAFNLGGFFRQRMISDSGKSDRRSINRFAGCSECRRQSSNTDSKGLGGYTGVSWLGDNFMAGMSVSHTDNRYGVPKV